MGELVADDCVLYRKNKCVEDAIKLQQDLDQLQQWEVDWQMEFNPKKCQALHVTNKRNIIKASCNIHGHILEETDTAKYLGVNIHHKLSWNHHIQKVISKANSTPAFLQRNTHLLRPVIEYASIIWDPHTNANINILEMVQRRYARFVFHDYRRSSSVIAMLDQLHWASLQAKVEVMFRIVNGLVDIPTSFLTPTLMMRGHSQRINILFHLLELSSTSTQFSPDGIGSGMLCHSSFRGQVQFI